MWWLRRTIRLRLRCLCSGRPRTWQGRTRLAGPSRTTPSGLPSSRETCPGFAWRRSAQGWDLSRWRGRRCGRIDACDSCPRLAAVQRKPKIRGDEVCGSLSTGLATRDWRADRPGRRSARGCLPSCPWPQLLMWWWPYRRRRQGRKVTAQKAWRWKECKSKF